MGNDRKAKGRILCNMVLALTMCVALGNAVQVEASDRSQVAMGASIKAIAVRSCFQIHFL